MKGELEKRRGKDSERRGERIDIIKKRFKEIDRERGWGKVEKGGDAEGEGMGRNKTEK